MKHINTYELDLLDLDTVTGGNISETAKDSQFLTEIGVMNDGISEMRLTFAWDSNSAAVDAGWASIGIVCVTVPFDTNRYYLNGKQIGRKAALNYAMQKTGKYIRITDYLMPYAS
ncbi:hypothetical protein SAMN02910264_01555 [Ruminococcaceae bacterium YAD3003]|nr:hypothetical protein SAMN02910264_01555 [Ruminococcaceae bacterium YAD3003]